MILRPTAAATRGFTMVSFTEAVSRGNTFVGGTCAPPSALLVLEFAHIFLAMGLAKKIVNILPSRTRTFFRLSSCLSAVHLVTASILYRESLFCLFFTKSANRLLQEGIVRFQ